MSAVQENCGPLISVNKNDDAVVIITYRVACLVTMASDSVDISAVDFEQIAIESAQRLGYDGLKEKQIEAIVSFLRGNDTFVALPTGYGKSLIYAVLPYSFDRIKGTVYRNCSFYVRV